VVALLSGHPVNTARSCQLQRERINRGRERERERK
jgi:hypothetical protein